MYSNGNGKSVDSDLYERDPYSGKWVPRMPHSQQEDLVVTRIPYKKPWGALKDAGVDVTASPLDQDHICEVVGSEVFPHPGFMVKVCKVCGNPFEVRRGDDNLVLCPDHLREKMEKTTSQARTNPLIPTF